MQKGVTTQLNRTIRPTNIFKALKVQRRREDFQCTCSWCETAPQQRAPYRAQNSADYF